MIRTAIISLGIVLGLASTASAQDEGKLKQAIDGDHRSAENKARDQYRTPFETLTFFGIEADDTVVEIYPGTGWYTEVLAPYLRGEGRLIAATYPRDPEVASDYMQQLNATYDAKLEAHPGVYDEVELVGLEPGEKTQLAEPGTVDVIFDSRNAHNWLSWGPENMLESWHEALKPGGMVAVIDHRMDPEREAGNGYIHESRLIEVMEANGFRFMASSEVNANPRDTKDHPGGVWNLPPTLRDVPEGERQHYLDIGESDRLTMTFIKQ